MRHTDPSFGDFKCARCQTSVSAARQLSGVNNRNHCPFCLWSRHLDLYAAGDRLSACKAPMQPIALTMKHNRNKYGFGRGELMLVHMCVGCGKLSINRAAADDDEQTLLSVFADSFALSAQTRDLLRINQIIALEAVNLPLVQTQLFGEGADLRVAQATGAVK